MSEWENPGHLGDPFAFALVCCLDRGMKSSAAGSIVRELERALGGLDPAELARERGFGVRFADLDRPGMDIKADVHTIRVLFRLGVARSKTPAAAIEGARRLNPQFPGVIDGALWVIGVESSPVAIPQLGTVPTAP